MNQKLTKAEREKILNLVFDNPDKSCAIVQTFIDSLQVVSISTYAKLKGKSKRSVLYNSKKLKGVEIEGRKFLVFI